MKTNRTQEEIRDKIKSITNACEDFFGVITTDLLMHLTDFNIAKEFLKEEVTAEEWDKTVNEEPKSDPVDYANFAWEKANDCRGLSASRSLDHYTAWLWLAGLTNDQIAEWQHDYEFYGKPQLVAACTYFGVDWQKLDNGTWVNSEKDIYENDPDMQAHRKRVIDKYVEMAKAWPEAPR